MGETNGQQGGSAAAEERPTHFCVLFDDEGAARGLFHSPRAMAEAEWREMVGAGDRRWDEIDGMSQYAPEEFDRLPEEERAAWSEGLESFLLHFHRGEGWTAVAYAEASYRI